MQAAQIAPSSNEVGQGTIEETQRERKPSINEMRNLVGLDPIADHPQETEIPTESSGKNDSLIDDGDFAEEADLATKRKLWQQGWPKVAVVALPLGLFCLALVAVFSALGGMKLTDAEEATDDVAVVESTDETAVQQQQEAEIARLKTTNALGNQASILDSQPTRRTEIRPTSQPTPVSVQAAQQPEQAAQQVPQQAAQPQPQQPTPRTRPIAVSRVPVTPTPRQPARRASPTPASVQVVRPQPVQAQPVQAQPAIRQTPVDPFAQWEKLAAVGSYGQVSDAINSSLDLSSEKQPSDLIEASDSTNIPILVGTVGAQQGVRRSQAEITTEHSRPLPRVMQDGDRNESAIAEKLNHPDEKAIAERSAHEKIQTPRSKAVNIKSLEVKPTAPQGQKISYWAGPGEAAAIESFEIAQAMEVAQQDSYEAGVSYIMRNAQPEATQQEAVILPGINARGEVITPVAWAQDIQSTAGSIELTEDLVSNGSVIMPAGTQLTVTLSEMSASGMMRLTVTSIILPESGYEHMQIPAEAITIQGAGGQILMAKDISGVDSELRRLDRNQALLGALGTVGSVLNRPSSSVNTVGVGGAGSSTTYGSPNIIGAVLEGSANTMIATQSARNQQRAAELQQRPAVWVLEQGTEIEIFISEAINVGK